MNAYRRFQLAEFRGHLRYRRAVSIGSGPTTIDYSRLSDYDVVLLVNHALAVAPLFARSSCQVFFFSLHYNLYQHRAELQQDNLVVCRPDCGAQIKGPTLFHRVINAGWPDLSHDGALRHHIRDREHLERENVLFTISNSMLPLLHFAYYTECPLLHMVGSSAFRGNVVQEYDPRLTREVDSGARPTDPGGYIAAIRHFARFLELPTKTLGE